MVTLLIISTFIPSGLLALGLYMSYRYKNGGGSLEGKIISLMWKNSDHVLLETYAKVLVHRYPYKRAFVQYYQERNRKWIKSNCAQWITLKKN